MSFKVPPEMDAHIREVSQGVEGFGYAYLLGGLVVSSLIAMATEIRKNYSIPAKLLPGEATVPITLVLHLHEKILDHWEDRGRFWVEENHCMSNYVMALAEEENAEPGYCHTCHRAQAYLGHLSFDEIRKVQERMPSEGAAC